MSGSIYHSMRPEDGVQLKGDQKTAFVSTMFDRIARRYDAMNLIISLGQTSYWRWRAFRGLQLPEGAAVLDVGTGPGNIPRMLHGRFRGVQVEGMDVSPGMLELARKADSQSRYFEGSVTAIPRPDHQYDLVTTILTLRNFPDLDLSLAEMIRVLKPGGRLMILDAFNGDGVVMPLLRRAWMRGVVPLLTAPFTDRKAYEYLAESIEKQVSVEDVAARLRGLGCSRVEITAYSFGSAALVVGVKGK
ncbi:MAG: Demethylmenaquinone methyltransferase [Myxococcota bacterium]|nr:Demethylmenaquinone methyltransferase [Myxococcota bacterium]